MRFFPVLCLLYSFLNFTSLGADESLIVQGFEGSISVDKWPSDKPGEVKITTEWKSEGTKSLKVDPGLMSTVNKFKTHNWKAYDTLRVHFNNTSDSAVTVGFELRDKHKGFRERHNNAFGIKAGVSVVDLDISGALWRGEENKPYLGKIKTPIEFDFIKRISFSNRGKHAIFIDQIEIVKVKKIKVDDAFAFDFGITKTQVMSQMIGITEKDAFNTKRGYGITGGRPSYLRKNMSFPTPMLGDSLGLKSGSFKIILKGGKYIGLIAFERGGFWEDEYSGYTKADLKLNNKIVHSHNFMTDGSDFLFQDTEIKNLNELAEKLIWPAHAINEFKFDASKGENSFTLDVKNSKGYPLRIAGLILAPDTKEGREFLDFHIQAQRKTIEKVFTAGDKSRRKGRAKPSKSLIAEELPVGEMIYPRDLPLSGTGSKIAPKIAVAGQTLTIHMGLYAKENLDLKISSKSSSKIKPIVSYGRYMPMRNYGVGSVWLEVNHYRPGHSFNVGPDLTRSLILEYKIPKDFGNGSIKDTLVIQAGKNVINLPIDIKVSKVALETLPIPVALFMNALPISEKKMESSEWWKLQEGLLEEQMSAGLTALSGGTSLSYKITGTDKVKITGDNAFKYIRMAQKYGPIHAIVGYGGFFNMFKKLKKNPKAVGDAILAMEKKENLPPHYVNSFDEPRSGTNHLSQVLSYLGPHKKGGIRTIGWSSWAHVEIITELAKNSYAVALNWHKAEDLKKAKDLGAEPWVYNNGLDRIGMGLRLWRSIKLGAKGRMQWIGLFTQGFAFHNLDGREPSSSCFKVHKNLGVLKTPRWLGVREGLADARLRLTLEKIAKKDDPALKAWTLDGYKSDAKKWTGQKLEAARKTMLKRILELSK